MKYSVYENGKLFYESYDWEDLIRDIPNHIDFNVIKTFPCRSCGEYKEDVRERRDFHGFSTGYWCEKDYEENYTYKKDDYTNGTGIADDGTPLI